MPGKIPIIALPVLAVTIVAIACSTVAPTLTAAPTTTPVPSATATPQPASPTPVPLPTATQTATPELVPTATPQREVLFDYIRAVQLLEIAEYEDAIAAFGLVIRLLPDLYLAYHGRGLAYYHDERFALALEDFDSAIEIKPDFAQAFKSRAALYEDQGERDKAVADLRMAISFYDRVRESRRLQEAIDLLEELTR